MSRHKILARVDRLLEAERGTIHKTAPFHFALVYPSPYYTAMSSLGFQVIYRAINDREDWAAARAFLPKDVISYRNANVSLFTYEEFRPVSESHVIGFSLAYELEISGLLTCLDLAGISPLSSERRDSDPLVIIGGPLTFSNPLPVAPFADVILMGEAEELIHRLLDHYEDLRSKDELLSVLAKIPGMYVPSIHKELPSIALASERFLPAFGQIITPNTALREMFLVEAERGCHRQCTYCVMRRSTNGGMRLMAPERILSVIPADAKRVGLVGAAVSDHPKLVKIARKIVDDGRELGISSLRADRLSAELVEVLAQGGYRTLTVSSDGISERIRTQLGKRIREKHLIEAANYTRKYKMRLLKVYLMVGVPGETEADLEELIRFQTELSKIAPIALGIAPFIAKRNTPLDKTPFAGIKSVNRTLKRIKKALGRRVDVRSTSSRWAWVEWHLAQGGSEMGHVALAATRNGGNFNAWKRELERILIHRRI